MESSKLQQQSFLARQGSRASSRKQVRYHIRSSGGISIHSFVLFLPPPCHFKSCNLHETPPTPRLSWTLAFTVLSVLQEWSGALLVGNSTTSCRLKCFNPPISACIQNQGALSTHHVIIKIKAVPFIPHVAGVLSSLSLLLALWKKVKMCLIEA